MKISLRIFKIPPRVACK